MAKFCPVLGRGVTYLVCQECEEKECKNEKIKTSSKKEEKGGKENGKEYK